MSVYIETDTALAEATAALSQAEVIALDTEFMRTDTYYPIPALLQLSDGTEIYLVDPLAVTDWQPLVDLFENPKVIKLLHSVSEDFEVFQRLLGRLPRPLLDTQVGAGLAGYGVGLGYRNLVREVLDIEVDKGETRSDWLQRPLSASQLDYAALDVEYLLPLYRAIRQRLENADRFTWWREEGERQVSAAEPLAEPEDYYRRIKTAWRLSPRQQGVLRALCAWREYKARELDIPRGRVVKDSACVDIARLQPERREQLAEVRDLRPSSLRRYGADILELVAASRRETPPQPLPGPLTGDDKASLQALRKRIDRIAEEVNVPRELLLTKRDLEATVRSGELPRSLSGWREELLAAAVNEVLAA